MTPPSVNPVDIGPLFEIQINSIIFYFIKWCAWCHIYIIFIIIEGESYIKVKFYLLHCLHGLMQYVIIEASLGDKRDCLLFSYSLAVQEAKDSVAEG